MNKKIFIKTFGCQMNEYDSNRIFDIVKNIGYEKSKLLNILKKNRIKGIDRIVPIGNSHKMDTKWDGYDMIYSLTRVIN